MIKEIEENLKELSETIINTFELQDSVCPSDWQSIDKEAHSLVLTARIAGISADRVGELLFYTHHNFIDEIYHG